MPGTRKINTWSDAKIKRKADEWLANELFMRETGGDELDPVAGWTDEQIQFENETTKGYKGARYREVHQHSKKKPQSEKATLAARLWEHDLQDSEWWAEVDKMGAEEAQALIDYTHAVTLKANAEEIEKAAEAANSQP
ncbi:MAG: hypothetical protein VX699_12340, partial [Myxococcota bacterium]|nr:hypothetical protein [Myxococcota bacterium]